VAVITAGEQRGFAAGKQESVTIAAQSLLGLAEARGIVLQRDELTRIVDEHDLRVLLRWTPRVATSSTAAELFSDD
jgi:hypothetical protein